MEGTIKVRPIVVTGTLTGTGFRVRWASATNKPTGTKFDVRYQVGSGPWTTWRNDTTAADGAFGAGNKPVHVMPGKTYRIQARSEKQQVSQHSDWSPSLIVNTPADPAGAAPAGPWISDPCAGCGRRSASAAPPPPAGPATAGRCGRRAGGPTPAAPVRACGRTAATRCRG